MRTEQQALGSMSHHTRALAKHRSLPNLSLCLLICGLQRHFWKGNIFAFESQWHPAVSDSCQCWLIWAPLEVTDYNHHTGRNTCLLVQHNAVQSRLGESKLSPSPTFPLVSHSNKWQTDFPRCLSTSVSFYHFISDLSKIIWTLGTLYQHSCLLSGPQTPPLPCSLHTYS